MQSSGILAKARYGIREMQTRHSLTLFHLARNVQSNILPVLNYALRYEDV
jgi:hypothetical protein